MEYTSFKKIKTIILVCLFLTNNYYFGFSQNHIYQCGTEVSKETFDYLRRNNPSIYLNKFSKRSNNHYNIPVNINIVEGLAGIEELQQAFDDLNAYFANADISFIISGSINFIEDPDLEVLNTGVGYTEIAQLVQLGRPGYVNLFIVNDICVDNSCGSILGFAYLPDGTASLENNSVFMKLQALEDNTLAHELGHYFSLYHTHGKYNLLTSGCPTGATLIECMGVVNETGNQGETTGDDVSDTYAEPPSPILYPEDISCLDPNISLLACQHTGGHYDHIDNVNYNIECNPVDPTGTPYNLLGIYQNNIMSYGYPRSCLNIFSGGQNDRMRNSYLQDRSNLKKIFFDLVDDLENNLEIYENSEVSYDFYSSDNLIGETIIAQVSYNKGTSWINIDTINSAEDVNSFSWQAGQVIEDTEVQLRIICEATGDFDVLELTIKGAENLYPCFNIVYTDYYYECANQLLKVSVGELINFAGRDCNNSNGGTVVINTNNNNNNNNGGGGPWNPGGGSGIGLGPSADVPVINENDECNECIKELQRKIQFLKIKK